MFSKVQEPKFLTSNKSQINVRNLFSKQWDSFLNAGFILTFYISDHSLQNEPRFILHTLG